MVSQFGSLGDTIMGKTADLTVVAKFTSDFVRKCDMKKQNITPELVRRNKYLIWFSKYDEEHCYQSAA